MARVTRRAALAAAALAIGFGVTGCAGSRGPTPSARARGSARGSASPSAASAAAHARAQAGLSAAIAAWEAQYQARIGLAVTDTGSRASLGYRADERFALDSTSKLLTAGLLLGSASDDQLGAVIRYQESDLVPYSPVTSEQVAGGMTLSAVIAAALQYSDNTAANLMYHALGGPAAAQSRLRAAGDAVTDLDRIEPDLNSAIPGDPRDTSTPAQMARHVDGLLLGSRLRSDRRAWLRQTMLGNTTGNTSIRAGVPAGWQVADKTGSGGYGTRNDVALLLPAEAQPIVLAIYTTRSDADAVADDALVAHAAQAAVSAVRAAS